MRGTLFLTILRISSSYARNIETPIAEDDVPDTLQWWIGDQTWRIRTYAQDHDIHTYSISDSGDTVLDLAHQNNEKHFGDVIARQFLFDFDDCTNHDEVARALSRAGLPAILEVAAGRFAFWKPDDARYRSQTRPS